MLCNPTELNTQQIVFKWALSWQGMGEMWVRCYHCTHVKVSTRTWRSRILPKIFLRRWQLVHCSSTSFTCMNEPSDHSGPSSRLAKACPSSICGTNGKVHVVEVVEAWERPFLVTRGSSNWCVHWAHDLAWPDQILESDRLLRAWSSFWNSQTLSAQVRHAAPLGFCFTPDHHLMGRPCACKVSDWLTIPLCRNPGANLEHGG